jgi:hypothetical protein
VKNFIESRDYKKENQFRVILSTQRDGIAGTHSAALDYIGLTAREKLLIADVVSNISAALSYLQACGDVEERAANSSNFGQTWQAVGLQAKARAITSAGVIKLSKAMQKQAARRLRK